MDVIEKMIHDEKKQAMYEEESLADMLFDKEDLLESGESLQDYYECITQIKWIFHVETEVDTNGKYN